MTKVSVVVPVYNASQHLRTTLDSLINQSLDDIEIIAIDDASTDNSLNILKEYEKAYPNKMRVLINSHNLGQGATRNKGIKLAKGEYIGFVDSDDYVSFEMYKTMYENASLNDFPEVIAIGLIFVRDNYYFDNNFKDLPNRKGSIVSLEKDSSFILNQSPSACNKLFRSDTIKTALFLENVMWEDVAFTYAKMFNAKNILNINTPGYFYRRTMDGVSGKGYNINPNILDIIKVADQLEKEVKANKRYNQFKYQIEYIQITSCLQRVVEIMSWPISTTEIKQLCLLMCQIIISKYGDWKKFSIEELSIKVGYLELERINNLIENSIISNISDVSYLEEQVNSFLIKR